VAFLRILRPGEPVFGASTIQGEGPLAISLRVSHLDLGIAAAEAVGLRVLRRTVGEEAGFGRHGVPARFAAAGRFGSRPKLVER
jgi:hypothetical protein